MASQPWALFDDPNVTFDAANATFDGLVISAPGPTPEPGAPIVSGYSPLFTPIDWPGCVPTNPDPVDPTDPDPVTGWRLYLDADGDWNLTDDPTIGPMGFFVIDEDGDLAIDTEVGSGLAIEMDSANDFEVG